MPKITPGHPVLGNTHVRVQLHMHAHEHKLEDRKIAYRNVSSWKIPHFLLSLGLSLHLSGTLCLYKLKKQNKNSNQKLAHNLKSHVIVIPLPYVEFHTAWCILYTVLCFVKVSLWCSVLHPCHKYSELYSMKKCWKQDHSHATVTLFFSVQTCIWILLYINYVFRTLITFQQPILCMSF